MELLANIEKPPAIGKITLEQKRAFYQTELAQRILDGEVEATPFEQAILDDTNITDNSQYHRDRQVTEQAAIAVAQSQQMLNHEFQPQLVAV